MCELLYMFTYTCVSPYVLTINSWAHTCVCVFYWIYQNFSYQKPNRWLLLLRQIWIFIHLFPTRAQFHGTYLFDSFSHQCSLLAGYINAVVVVPKVCICVYVRTETIEWIRYLSFIAKYIYTQALVLLRLLLLFSFLSFLCITIYTTWKIF